MYEIFTEFVVIIIPDWKLKFAKAVRLPGAMTKSFFKRTAILFIISVKYLALLAMAGVTTSPHLP